MKRSLVAASAGLAALAVSGCGGPPDTIESAYGNTLVARLPDGGEVRYFFNADGSYSARTPNGQLVAGTYAIEDGQLCTTSAIGTQCSRYLDDKRVGDSWTQTRADGQTVTLQLVEGR